MTCNCTIIDQHDDINDNHNNKKGVWIDGNGRGSDVSMDRTLDDD